VAKEYSAKEFQMASSTLKLIKSVEVQGLLEPVRHFSEKCINLVALVCFQS